MLTNEKILKAQEKIFESCEILTWEYEKKSSCFSIDIIIFKIMGISMSEIYFIFYLYSSFTDKADA